MRLWSVHPRYLDRQGLTACWREALLAQAVLAGRTRGYRSHPQLERFRATTDPAAAIGAYLDGVATEADARGYRFDRGRVDARPRDAFAWGSMPVTDGQVAHEWAHLLAKLRVRSPGAAATWATTTHPDPHPLFVVVRGPVERWERTTDAVTTGALDARASG
jgi:hypothetical protein